MTLIGICNNPARYGGHHLENNMLYFFIICCIVGSVMGWAIVRGGSK